MASKRKPNGYYTLENTISESKKVMEEHGFDTLPSSNKLRELGYSGLSRAISIHHSGFPNFREIMNQELGIKSKVNQFMFTSIENTQEDRKHFRKIMNQELGIKSNEKEESNKITLKPLYSLGYLQKKTDFGKK